MFNKLFIKVCTKQWALAIIQNPRRGKEWMSSGERSTGEGHGGGGPWQEVPPSGKRGSQPPVTWQVGSCAASLLLLGPPWQRPRARQSTLLSPLGRQGGCIRDKHGSAGAVRGPLAPVNLYHRRPKAINIVYIFLNLHSLLHFWRPRFFHSCLQIPLLNQGSNLMTSKWCKRLAPSRAQDLPQPGPQHPQQPFICPWSSTSPTPIDGAPEGTAPVLLAPARPGFNA